MRLIPLLILVASPPCSAQSMPPLMLGAGKGWETPVYVNDSGVDGPAVVVTGGVQKVTRRTEPRSRGAC